MILVRKLYKTRMGGCQGSALGRRSVRGGEACSEDSRIKEKPRLTAQHRAGLKLQGKYMGTRRGLKPRQRARVKKVRAAKGIRAAIKAAERAAG